MWKLIKMDTYRLFSGKALKIGAILACAAAIVYVFFSLGIIALSKVAFQQDPAVAYTLGELLSQIYWMNGVDFAEVVFQGTSVFALFIGCMITANFIGSEQSCGFAKNYAGQLTNKGYMAVSKFLVTSSVQVLILALYVIIITVLAKLFLGQYINGYNMKELFAALGLRSLLHIAINAIIIFICTFTRSHAIAMVVGSIFGIGITRFVYIAIGLLLRLMKVNFQIANYMPDGVNSQLAIGEIGDLYGKAIAVSLVVIVVFVSANFYLMRRRDVK